MTRRRPHAGVLAMAVLLAIVLGELVARAGLFALERQYGLPVEPVYSHRVMPEQRAEWERLIEGRGRYVRFDRDLGWSILPSAEMGIYRSNATGLRGLRDYSTRPGAGVLRIAAMGDSFVHCDDVPNDQTWPHRIEESHPEVEVLNYGVGGFAPDQAYLRYRRDARSVGASVVMIGVMTENITRMVTRFRLYQYPRSGLPLSKPRFRVSSGGGIELVPNPLTSASDYRRLLDGDPEAFAAVGRGDYYYESGFHRRAIDVVGMAKLMRLVVHRLGERLEPEPIFRGGIYNERSEAFRVLVGVVAAFVDEVRRDGARPLVVVFPHRGDIENALAGESRQYGPFRDFLVRESIPFVDLNEAFEDAARSHGVAGLIDEHYTDLGNRLVAEVLHPALVKRAADPPDALAARRTDP